LNNKDFDKFYKKYNKPIYLFILKMTKYNHNLSDDILQDTFLKAYNYLKTGTLNHSYEKTWLCSIAKNSFLDYIRKEKYRSKTVSIDQPIDETFSLIDCLKDDTDYNIIDNNMYIKSEFPKSMENLKIHSPTLYSTFSTYLQLDNYKDTAEDNNILLDTAKTRILRARRFLKKDLPEDFIALIQN